MNTNTQNSETACDHMLFVARRLAPAYPAQVIALCATHAEALAAIERDKRAALDAGARNYAVHTVCNPLLTVS